VTKAIRKRAENNSSSTNEQSNYDWPAEKEKIRNMSTTQRRQHALTRLSTTNDDKFAHIARKAGAGHSEIVNAIKSKQKVAEDTVNEVSKGMAHNYMVAAHKKFDSASEAKKAKLIKGIKKASERRNPKPAPSPEQKVDMSSPGGYYASKKPGEYTGD
jgi:hypothetical protein